MRHSQSSTVPQSFRPKLILLDFDGTIADTFEATLETVNALSPRFGYKPIARADAVRLRDRSIREILKETDLPLRQLPQWIHAVRQELNNRIAAIEPVADLGDVLRTLRQEDIALGIVTSNSRENIDAFLANHRWTAWFDHFECGSSLFGKGRLIKRAAARAKVRLDETVYVGDEARDIEAARAAGVAAAAVTWGFNTRSVLERSAPDFLFEQPHELLDFSGTASKR